jgi:hypothetical protein
LDKKKNKIKKKKERQWIWAKAKRVAVYTNAAPVNLDRRAEPSRTFVCLIIHAVAQHVRVAGQTRKKVPLSENELQLSSGKRYKQIKQEVLGRTNRLLPLRIHYFVRHWPHRKHRVQHLFNCCVCFRCRGNVFTGPLPSIGRLFCLHYSGFQALGGKHKQQGDFKNLLLFFKIRIVV